MTGKIYFLANIYTLKHEVWFFLLVSSLHLNFAPVPQTQCRLWAHFAACASRDATSPGPAMYCGTIVPVHQTESRRLCILTLARHCFSKFWKLQIEAGRRIE